MIISLHFLQNVIGVGLNSNRDRRTDYTGVGNFYDFWRSSGDNCKLSARSFTWPLYMLSCTTSGDRHVGFANIL